LIEEEFMKTLSCLFALLVCSLSVIGVSAQETTKQELLAAAAPKRDNPPATPRGYMLGPGDEIVIKVMDEKQFDGEYTVDEDGKIVIAFINRPIQATCRTEKEIREDVEQALRKYLKNPRFSLQVTKKVSRAPAAVHGEVRNPQQFGLNRPIRLLELLSYAGGWTEKAGGTIQVFHTQPIQCPEPGEEIEPPPSADGLNMPFKVYKLSEIASGKNEANPFIRPGDVVTVQKAPPVYVVGEVRTAPSPQDPITIPESGLTLSEAIARAGGLTREAKKKDVRIYRLKEGSKELEVIATNLDKIKNKNQPDVVLQPYDVIEVEKAPKTIGQFMTEILANGAKQATSILPLRMIPY
jgi:polysaccharide export outer membrane protein